MKLAQSFLLLEAFPMSVICIDADETGLPVQSIVLRATVARFVTVVTVELLMPNVSAEVR